MTNTDGALEGFASVTGRVEFLTVFQRTSVVDGDGVTNFWENLSVTFQNNFNFSSAWAIAIKEEWNCLRQVAREGLSKADLLKRASIQ